jgi:hypothetical protein
MHHLSDVGSDFFDRRSFRLCFRAHSPSRDIILPKFDRDFALPLQEQATVIPRSLAGPLFASLLSRDAYCAGDIDGDRADYFRGFIAL